MAAISPECIRVTAAPAVVTLAVALELTSLFLVSPCSCRSAVQEAIPRKEYRYVP